MLRRVWKFLVLDRPRKVLFVQAWFVMGSVRYALARKPFKELTTDLKIHRDPVSLTPLAEGPREIASQVGWSVRTSSKFTPWKSTCLVQVLAAQKMLKKRDIPGVFYIGAASGAAENEPPGLLAHAWLKCNDEFITGEPGHQKYTVISSFSW